MVSKLSKGLDKFRRANPKATIDQQKMHVFELILALDPREGIAMMPTGMTAETPARIELSIINPERPDMQPLTVSI